MYAYRLWDSLENDYIPINDKNVYWDKGVLLTITSFLSLEQYINQDDDNFEKIFENDVIEVLFDGDFEKLLIRGYIQKDTGFVLVLNGVEFNLNDPKILDISVVGTIHDWCKDYIYLDVTDFKDSDKISKEK